MWTHLSLGALKIVAMGISPDGPGITSQKLRDVRSAEMGPLPEIKKGDGIPVAPGIFVRIPGRADH
jgi:hypothetical protein